jgi:type IV secretory pathway VirB4 component
MVSLDLSRVSGNDTLLSLVMTCASAWMEAALLDPDGGRRWVVYDEAWRVMRHPALIRRMQAQWKLSRAYGIANLMVIHRLSDLDAVGDQRSEARALAQGLLADCSTRIIYRQEADQLAASAAALGLTDTERDLLPGLGIGQGLWRVRDRSFIVQHQMTHGEHQAFDTTARMHAPA